MGVVKELLVASRSKLESENCGWIEHKLESTSINPYLVVYDD